jgi:hypothetical protein
MEVKAVEDAVEEREGSFRECLWHFGGGNSAI